VSSQALVSPIPQLPQWEGAESDKPNLAARPSRKARPGFATESICKRAPAAAWCGSASQLILLSFYGRSGGI
jgi:hypothetical protein